MIICTSAAAFPKESERYEWILTTSSRGALALLTPSCMSGEGGWLGLKGRFLKDMSGMSVDENSGARTHPTQPSPSQCQLMVPAFPRVALQKAICSPLFYPLERNAWNICLSAWTLEKLCTWTRSFTFGWLPWGEANPAPNESASAEDARLWNNCIWKNVYLM